MMGFAGTGILIKKISGTGTVWLADDSKDVHLLYVREGERVYVNQESVLAFDQDMDWSIKMYGPSNLSGVVFTMFMFVVILKGPGVVAITTKGEVLSLDAGPDTEQHLLTEADSTILWSNTLKPKPVIKNLKGKLVGQSTKLRLQFRGPETGFVLLQPSHCKPPSLLTSLTRNPSSMIHLARSTNAEITSAATAGMIKYKNALTTTLSRRAGSQAKLSMERSNSGSPKRGSKKLPSPTQTIESPSSEFEDSSEEEVEFTIGQATPEQMYEWQSQIQMEEIQPDLPPSYE